MLLLPVCIAAPRNHLFEICHHNSDRLKHHIQETIVCVRRGGGCYHRSAVLQPRIQQPNCKSVPNRSFQKPVKQQDDSSSTAHYELISIHELQIGSIKVMYKSLIFCQIHVILVYAFLF